ncbi:hypothetical protein BKA67DRAFT_575154 [Truncatella angustata]|uniref:Uncharacterized protein n=1 Tax=Truncatella angustata TaxID=152316 RepID=A0A9P8ZTH9_9PEZI|nr:uncharacterized protein BKA67DRAFT_575154 [Truncatella angustata]KAH6648547.1 hypothetical protein BKA67DRAFT_575154 [Truncatella angustata]
MFFVASAPLCGRHINLYPKSLPEASFAALCPNQAAFVDSIGSGCESICYLGENVREKLIFCSFEKNSRILRRFCTGFVVEGHEPDFDHWQKKMGNKSLVGARATIMLDIFKSKYLADLKSLN